MDDLRRGAERGNAEHSANTKNMVYRLTTPKLICNGVITEGAWRDKTQATLSSPYNLAYRTRLPYSGLLRVQFSGIHRLTLLDISYRGTAYCEVVLPFQLLHFF